MDAKELERYATSVQKRTPARYRTKQSGLKPNVKKIKGVKAVLIDIYGTFFTSNYYNSNRKSEETAFKETAKEFKLGENWKKIKELCWQEIEKEHKRKMAKGTKFPEVLTENVWAKALRTLGKKDVDEFKAAYFFEWIRDRNRIYANALSTLQKLREKGIIIGIASDCQFYTLINLNVLLERESNGRIKGWQDFFEPSLSTFSFKLGFSKPNTRFFEKQKKIFRAGEMVMVGNDILRDIWTAKKAGLKTVLFAGDGNSLKLRKDNKKVRGIRSDVIITDWRQMLEVIR